MKYQILLVDDEKIYLQYLQSMIDWEKMDCEICGCASNGEEAIHMVEKKNPDIVFMDINMSQMDGLEACEHLRKKKYSARIIIMTAYNEFSFAHRAIKLNVFDYLLKPFDEEELIGTLKRCIQEIKKERQSQREQKENFLKSLLDSNMSGEERVIVEKKLMNYRYAAVFIHRKKEIMFEERENFIRPLTEYFAPMSVESYFLGNQNGYGIVIHMMMEAEISEPRIKELYQCFIEEHPEEEIQWVAIGDVVKGLEKLRSTYQHARQVWENRVKVQGRVSCYKDIQKLHEEVTLVNNGDTNLLIKAFEMKEYEKADRMIEKMFALSEYQMFSFQYVIATYYSLVTGIYSYYHYNEENNLSTLLETQSNLISEISLCDTSDQMLEIVRNYIYEVFSDCINVRVGNKKEVLVGKIEDYLQVHYGEQALSVNQIAEAIFFENSYIRRVFKLQTGKTIMQRLEEIRLEKARALLVEGEYLNSEIAQMTGYCDQYYFSKRFKLFCGCSPSEYQMGKNK